MSKHKPPATDAEFEIVKVDLAEGPVNVLRRNLEAVIALAQNGDEHAIQETLRSINRALSTGNQLTRAQADFLADGLAGVLANLGRYGRPFGFVPKRGRPEGTGKVSGWNWVRLGRLVDKLHHPDRYDLAMKPIQVEDNALGPGAYTLVAERTGISISTVKRAYTSFLRHFGGSA